MYSLPNYPHLPLFNPKKSFRKKRMTRRKNEPQAPKRKIKPEQKRIAAVVCHENGSTLHMDWAPSHGSRSTLSYLTRSHIRFWGKDVYPSVSPELNPLDFSVFAQLEQKVCKRSYRSVKELNRALKKAAKEVTDAGNVLVAVRQLPKRLEKLIGARGDHFEHLPWRRMMLPKSG